MAGMPVDGAEFHLREGRLTSAWQADDGPVCAYRARSHDGVRALRGKAWAQGLASAAVDDPSLRSRLATANLVLRRHGLDEEGPGRCQRSGAG